MPLAPRSKLAVGGRTPSRMARRVASAVRRLITRGGAGTGRSGWTSAGRQASIRGWTDAANDPEGAVDAVLENDETGLSQSMDKQIYAMEQVAKLVNAEAEPVGYLDPEAFERSVQVLLIGGGDAPVITEEPEGAWTHEIYEEATAE